MKLLLDTTYFLPAIGVSIKELSKDAPIKLLAKGHHISVSHITLFELSAKGAKYVNNGMLLPESVAEGIRAIVHDDEIETIPIHDSKLLLTSFNLKNALTDFIDCLIVSSAINYCDAIITEDNDIQNLTKNRKLGDFMAAANPNFKIQMLSDIL